ncbi:TetR/AcrR family transcriptional regulator [Nocardioides marmoriginsengisoli]|uniref:TetR/AcrR family transcriptional regulator n=1 Tax=Nocardioides marmoriginsengisoli TaxID=661483 RepID=A0A3N0CR37_9ACTN|nr:TetR/AcrR family transcriptional regulator [Nocardioides marmoriginsengisoli]RNL65496.1 TetR/AcrR family transcriptional regulator [Nocardioides marmoriginsengisoli]
MADDVRIDAGASSEGAPKLRADAARNRAKLVTTAREVFTEVGGEASLDQIAKAAGVGIGTLYRHFPTRLDLLEAVYRDEVDVLRETAEKVIPNHTPVEALELWLVAFVDYAATKRHIFTELVEAVGRESELMTHSRGVIYGTAETLVVAAQQAGEIRADVTSPDVLRLVGGCTMMPNFDRDQTERILRIVMDGLKVG